MLFNLIENNFQLLLNIVVLPLISIRLHAYIIICIDFFSHTYFVHTYFVLQCSWNKVKVWADRRFVLSNYAHTFMLSCFKINGKNYYWPIITTWIKRNKKKPYAMAWRINLYITVHTNAFTHTNAHLNIHKQINANNELIYFVIIPSN